MQLELPDSVAEALAPQALVHGLSLTDYVAELITRFAFVSASQRVQDPDFNIRTDDDAVAWILSRNPSLLHNRPEDTDWQALKAAGRRY